MQPPKTPSWLALGALVSTFSLLFLSSASSTARADESVAPLEGPRPSTEGFYPIWETTAFVERHREAYIGTNGAHYGIRDVAQVGVQPVNFMYRTPNVYGKMSLFERDGWRVAGQVGVYYLMDAASRSFFSPSYSSRLDNPDFSMVLVPLSATATRQFSDWLDLHQTLTVLGEYSASGPIERKAYIGYTAVAELKAKANHSLLLHAGEVGFWEHDFGMLGISYRYHNTWLEVRAGYFYRKGGEGMQSAPLISLGFVI